MRKKLVPSSRKLRKSNGAFSSWRDWRMQVKPQSPAMMSSGSMQPKIMRQPAMPTIMPPNAGPSAGPRTMTRVAIPMMVAVFLNGTCSRMMMFISGIVIPPLMPCRIRPMISTEKLGDQSPSSVPMVKNAQAAMKRVFILKRLVSQDDVGMMIASISRLTVVTHCTVDVGMPNSCISVGKMTFMAVSEAMATNPISPRATTEMMSRASRRRSKVKASLML